MGRETGDVDRKNAVFLKKNSFLFGRFQENSNFATVFNETRCRNNSVGRVTHS